MVGYLWGVGQNYNHGELINSIGFSYKLCQIISEIKQKGIEWGLIELKQHSQDSNFSKLIQPEHKLKLVPELFNLGATIEQISEALELDIELVSVGVKTNTNDIQNSKSN